MQAQKTWEKPGDCQVKEHEGLISSHPGEDRDTDSEDEEPNDKKQLPVPIQDEPVEETSNVEAPVSVDSSKESVQTEQVELPENNTKDISESS